MDPFNREVILNGVVTAQMQKTATIDDEFRVHEEYGGICTPVAITKEARSIAVQAYAAGERILECELSYARVDLLRFEGRLVVSELEIIEPQLYLDAIAGQADLFAETVRLRIRTRRGEVG